MNTLKTFTKENKITFYTQRKRAMENKFIRAMNENKKQLSDKLVEEIMLCERELRKLGASVWTR